ncbi:hypothetical protein ACFOYU_06115 [Microvirga sp. GCM10011540]|uniref:hypothetical protein n=1 Tax=Microvirga sp. GCM10011540 TaxID=3317338 RepID=UPI003610BDA7
MAERTIDTDTLMKLYGALASQSAGKATIANMTMEERRAYDREARRRSRQRVRESIERGSPEPTSAMIREALADAALMILASGAPGADQIRNVLAMAFPGRGGVPGTVTVLARSGRLRPKLVKLQG